MMRWCLSGWHNGHFMKSESWWLAQRPLDGEPAVFGAVVDASGCSYETPRVVAHATAEPAH